MRPSLVAILLLAAAAPACRAQPAPDLRAPTSDEMDFLAANCPNNHIIRAGTVVAYGEILEAPLLVTTDQGRILINGAQVVPRPPTDAGLRARMIAGRLHSQFYLDEQKKDARASARIEERLNEMKANRTIDDFQTWKRHGKLAAFLIKAGGGQARAYLDALPPPLSRRYQFLVAAMRGEYLKKEETDGKETAQSWLRARLEELKASGKIEELRMEPEREAAKIRFAGETAAIDYAFGEDKTPFGVAYASRWKARRGETEAAARGIAERLKAGGALIYSYSFEKARPADAAALNALEGVAEGKDADANLAIARERLKLTDEQARSLGEELR